jgi:hypothetical protein
MNISDHSPTPGDGSQNTDHSNRGLPPQFLAELGSLVATGLLGPVRDQADSPPESMLTLALLVLTQPGLASGAITLRQRERLVMEPTEDVVEVDLLLQRSLTGAAAVIEVHGHRWHTRLTPARFERQLARERELRSTHEVVMLFAASEVLRDAWTVALEIVALLLRAGLLTKADVSGDAVGAAFETRKVCDPHLLAPRTISSPLQQARAYARANPGTTATASSLSGAARAFETWTDAERQILAACWRAWVDAADIAAALERTVGAIWEQARRLGLVGVRDG